MKEYLHHPDWNPEVKDAMNALIASCGIDSEDYDPSCYAVSDSDNTISVFDVEHQLAVYQLQVMAFAFAPEEIERVLYSGLGDHEQGRTGCTLDGKAHSYTEWVKGIHDAYSILYQKYGPFTAQGVSEEMQNVLQKDPVWMEFAVKMRAMYALVTQEEDGRISCPWLLAWFKGMNEQEVYDLAYRSHRYYSAVPTEKVTWTSPEDYESHLGRTAVTWTAGIAVTENIGELFRELHDHGIAVWVCSASGTDPIRAAIDCFGLHEYVEGMMAMTMKLENGIYTEEYDFTEGMAWKCLPNGKWEKDNVPTCVQTQGQGKVTAIENVLVSRKGHGPVAGFGDSSGDFPFLTQFASMKAAICFNRADRNIKDGGGVLAELAVYQKDTLQYDYDKAQSAGDILYVLQGRDETGLRSLRNCRKTIRAGQSEERLFADERNEAQLAWMMQEKPSCAEILKSLACIHHEEQLFDFEWGFLKEDPDYRTRK